MFPGGTWWLAGWQQGQRECCLSLGFGVSAEATEGGRKGGDAASGGASVIRSVWGRVQVTGAEPRRELELGVGIQEGEEVRGGEEKPEALGPSGWNPVVTSDSDSSGVWAQRQPLASKFSKRKLRKPNLGHEMLCKEGNS